MVYSHCVADITNNFLVQFGHIVVMKYLLSENELS